MGGSSGHSGSRRFSVFEQEDSSRREDPCGYITVNGSFARPIFAHTIEQRTFKRSFHFSQPEASKPA
jgi:hypothetical protein